MTVYLDTLFFVNFVFDYCLLSLNAVFLQFPIKRFRFLLGSSFGALCGVGIFIGNFHEVFNIGCLLLSSIGMLVISYGKMAPLKKFLRILLSFYAIVFLLGSILFALLFLTNLGMRAGAAFHSGVFYLRMSTLSLLLLLACGDVLLRGIVWFLKKHCHELPHHVTLEFTLFEKQFSLIGLLDTGNRLSDPLYHKPVIVLAYDTVKEALTKKQQDFIKTEENMADMLATFHRISFHALGCEKGYLWGLAPISVTIITPKKTINTEKAVVAFYPNLLSHSDSYSAIIPQTLMEQ